MPLALPADRPHFGLAKLTDPIPLLSRQSHKHADVFAPPIFEE